MGQEEVLKELNKKEWKTAKEIGEKFGMTRSSIANSLMKLYKYNEVIRRYINIGGYWTHQYKLK